MLEAKVEMMMRPETWPNSSWKASPMVRSEGVKPSRSALVLSDISSMTPRFPKCERRAMSVGWPSTGVWSICKSPASMTTMFSSYSSAIMLRPISPRPPRGMARNLGCLAKKGELLLRLGDRLGGGSNHLTPLLHPVEVGLDGFEVLLQRPHQETVIQGGRRMIDGDVA